MFGMKKKSTFKALQQRHDQLLSEMSGLKASSETKLADYETKLAAHKKSIADLEHDLKILQVKYTISQQQQQALQVQYNVLKQEHDKWKKKYEKCVTLLNDIPLTSKVKGGSMLIQRRAALVPKTEVAVKQEEEQP